MYFVAVCKMPSSLLFAINNEGRVFGLSTTGTKWREFVYLGLEFKHLSAVPHFMWAVGGDRQVYVHVHGLDIPIRIKEEAYENEVMFRRKSTMSRIIRVSLVRENIGGKNSLSCEEP